MPRGGVLALRVRVLVAAAVAAGAILFTPAIGRTAAPIHGHDVVAIYPHDPDAFTQGLLFKDGFLYESTGLYGGSSIRKVDIASGTVLKRRDLPVEYFGEGLAALGDTFYQITWENQIGFAYVEEDLFELVETYPYPWEGWGLTTDGARLIASDGSDTLRFLDAETRDQISFVVARDGASPVRMLNELEYVQGKVYANVLGIDRVAVIDPATGAVEAWLDLSGLRSLLGYLPDPGALNGLAFDPAHLRLFATGKRWPKLFEIDTDLLHGAGAGGDQGSLDPSAAPPMLVYPNPCRDRATLSFIESVAAPLRLRLCDIQGRLILAHTETGPAGARIGAVPLGLSGLSPGAYFLSIQAPGVTYAGKVHVAG